MKFVKHIPNTITSMNLLCGALGVIFAFKGALDIAFYLMLAGAVCDFCDGFAARILKAYSPMGKELDSLADLITFGFLPSIMLYKCMDIYHPGEWYCYLPLIIVVFSALRLAKFNIDETQREEFEGLPTPGAAILCLSVAAICEMYGIVVEQEWLCLLSVLTAAMLVSPVRMFSFKFKSWRWSNNKLRYIFLVSCILAISLLRLYAIPVIIVLYIAISTIRWIIQKR